MFSKTKIENPKVLKTIENLRESISTHADLINYMFSSDNGAFYPVDILAFATLNRSLNLLIPFCELISEKNIIASAPLIRMQLDNVLRFYAVFLVNEPHNFATEVMNGKAIKNIKDVHGNKMTDRYLHTQLASEEGEEWISNVYNTTSGFIHFSDRHIFISFGADENSNKIKGKITYGEHDADDLDFQEAIEAFSAITQLLFKYIHGWCYTKANPNIV